MLSPQSCYHCLCLNNRILLILCPPRRILSIIQSTLSHDFPFFPSVISVLHPRSPLPHFDLNWSSPPAEFWQGSKKRASSQNRLTSGGRQLCQSFHPRPSDPVIVTTSPLHLLSIVISSHLRRLMARVCESANGVQFSVVFHSSSALILKG